MQEISIAVVGVGPQQLARLTAERIVFFSLGRDRQHVPLLTTIRRCLQNATGKIVFVPSSLYQYPAALWPSAGLHVRPIPFPLQLAIGFRIGVLARAQRIVDDHAVSAETGDASADSGRFVLAALIEP